MSKARAIADIPENPIHKGNKSDLTILSPDEKWVFTKDKIISQTENSPFLGKELKGSIVGIINNGNLACRE